MGKTVAAKKKKRWNDGLPPGNSLDFRLNDEYDYIDDDGYVMPAAQRHLDATSDLIDKLRRALELSGKTGTVNGNIYFLWDPEDAKDRFAPDVFVVLGVPHQDGPHYHAWEFDGRIPCLAVELGSKDTREVDVGRKRRGYQKAGIPHYVCFDLTDDAQHDPGRLKVWDLRGGRYLRRKPESIGGQPRWWIPSLDISIADGGWVLEVFDSAGKPIRASKDRAEEEARGRLAAEAEAIRERQQRAEAEAEAIRERQQRAKAEAEAALERQQRAQAEAATAAMAAELAALRAAIAKQSANGSHAD